MRKNAVTENTPCAKCKTNPRMLGTKRIFAYCYDCHREKQIKWATENPEAYALRMKQALDRQNKANKEKRDRREHQRKILNSQGKGYPTKLQQVFDATKIETDDCIEFDGAKSHLGYGQVQWNGRAYPAHRLALELYLGRPIRDGYETLHSCDNRACLNIGHLREGTHKENMAEAAERGRMSGKKTVGIKRTGNVKYTKEQIKEALALAAEGIKTAKVAKITGIHASTLYNVLNGYCHKDLYGDLQ